MTKKLTIEQQEKLLKVLKARFEKNMNRHKNVDWSAVEARLVENPLKLWSLNEMEITDGEPDVVKYDVEKDIYIFVDCAKESPKGRRSLCYDRKALESRKNHPPKSSIIDIANEIGIAVLDEEQYRELQKLGDFDTKTSSWLLTPSSIRDLGGAIFGDYRYGQVFIYHNGAESYYAGRAFRGFIEV